ncbi:vesicle transport protein SEC20 isoform X2 [Muntiacus reevesi]|uniref:vesicle transport protein SEC20 isoform X2 n=1 Tax=Muntiacus reevesi TaxID=9886 RepID=UPI003306DD19
MGRTWGDAPVQAFLTIPSFFSSRSTPRGRLIFPTCQAKATRLGATTLARLRPVSSGRCRKTRRLRRRPVRKRVGTWAPRLPVAGISNMATAQDVHVRICNQEIVKFDLEVKALIQDIRDCSGPLSALTELNTKVKEKFQQLRHRIQELEQSAKEQDKESEKQVLLQEVENHKKQMLSNQTSWRKANLTCKIAIDNLEKAELLQGGDLFRQRITVDGGCSHEVKRCLEDILKSRDITLLIKENCQREPGPDVKRHHREPHGDQQDDVPAGPAERGSHADTG